MNGSPKTGPDLPLQQAYLREAVVHALRGVQRRLGGPFGAVLVSGDEVVAAACNEVLARCDPTAHAEILAVREAAAKLGRRRLADCVAYTSCEPCPMCLAALGFARVGAVYYAASAEEAAAEGWAPPAGVVSVAPGQAIALMQLAIPERHLPFGGLVERRAGELAPTYANTARPSLRSLRPPTS